MNFAAATPDVDRAIRLAASLPMMALRLLGDHPDSGREVGQRAYSGLETLRLVAGAIGSSELVADLRRATDWARAAMLYRAVAK